MSYSFEPIKPPINRRPVLQKQCDHKYVHLETIKERGERPSFGMSVAKDWTKVDRFFCEKCLDKKETIQTAPGWEEKPFWF